MTPPSHPPRSIWIIGDRRAPHTWQASLKVLAKTVPLSEAANAPRTMVLLGCAGETPTTEGAAIEADSCPTMEQVAEEAAACGADHVLMVSHPALAVLRPDLAARALEPLINDRSPWVVVMLLNDFGRETAGLCVHRCNAGMIADCEELAAHDGQVVGRCPAWGGSIMADITLAKGHSRVIVTMQPAGGRIPDRKSGHGTIESVTPEGLEVPHALQLTRRCAVGDQARRLEEARTVVVGGAGLGSMKGFGLVRELAVSLGAEVGATRPPVMNHWVEEERLIGQTGKSVRPQLLISVGTSGAIQYTAGITEASTIVAINRDPKAPIFQMADIGIVADANALLPLLTRKTNQLALRRLADASCVLQDEGAVAETGFGPLVRQLREARQWSAEELAQRTGQTPEFVAQVEAGTMSPPVAFILRMAQAMEVDPGTFLSREEQTAIRDRRAQAYHQRTQNYSYTTLTPEAENSHLRAFMVSIEPHLTHKPVAYKHEGEEFIFVMQGKLEFTLGSKVHVLQEGESIHFNSDIPHKLRNLSSATTRCLVVLYTI